jgi:hypothetical protein
MSSLWTPGGERQVPRDQGAGSAGPPPGDPFGDEPPEGSEEEMQAIAAQLLAAPVEDVIANHCYGLFELAALHLSQQPPNLEQARGAIDAMGLLVEGLGDRLGQHQSGLAEGLNQLRLAWVKLSELSGAPQSDGEVQKVTPEGS